MSSSLRVDTCLTDQLSTRDTDSIRGVLGRAFGGTYDDHDWDHALGGHHVVVRRDELVVAHASAVARTMWIADTSIEVGYVEAVATDPELHGTGLGTLAMASINEIIAGRFRLGFLSTGAHHFYERLGWERWLGPTFVRRRDGVSVRTPDEDDGIMVLMPATKPAVDRAASLACEERTGDDW